MSAITNGNSSGPINIEHTYKNNFSENVGISRFFIKIEKQRILYDVCTLVK